jgi:HSP90 family molecular chaperone
MAAGDPRTQVTLKKYPRSQGAGEKEWSDKVRRRIQASKIVNNLIKFADTGVGMSKDQITVNLALLRKALPDLSSVELKGDKESPIQIIISAKDSQV